MKKIFLFTLLMFTTTFFSAAQEINKKESSVVFKAVNMEINTVKGVIKGFSGTINFSPDNLSNAKISVCIDAKTINTGNDKRDEHLRSADFFEVEKYPKICFTSTKIIKKEENYLAKGTLTMHGVSKEVKVPLIYKDNSLSGKITLQRLDFKIGEDTGGFMVSKEIEVYILCQFKD